MQPDVATDKLERAAKRMAVECRWVDQDCLREEEWRDADQEFALIILAGLKGCIRAAAIAAAARQAEPRFYSAAFAAASRIWATFAASSA